MGNHSIINYIATIVHLLWLAAKWARCLVMTGQYYSSSMYRCPRHTKFAFNLTVDIYVMVNSLSKKVYLRTNVTRTYHGLKCATHWGGMLFLKLFADQLLVWIEYRLMSDPRFLTVKETVPFGFDCITSFVLVQWTWPLTHRCWKLLPVFFYCFYCIQFNNSTKKAI